MLAAKHACSVLTEAEAGAAAVEAEAEPGAACFLAYSGNRVVSRSRYEASCDGASGGTEVGAGAAEAVGGLVVERLEAGSLTDAVAALEAAGTKLRATALSI